jgi:hypothetical protein
LKAAVQGKGEVLMAPVSNRFGSLFLTPFQIPVVALPDKSGVPADEPFRGGVKDAPIPKISRNTL